MTSFANTKITALNDFSQTSDLCESFFRPGYTWTPIFPKKNIEFVFFFLGFGIVVIPCQNIYKHFCSYQFFALYAI
jgi:hypothetical protein